MKGVLYGIGVVVVVIIFATVIWAGSALAQGYDLCQAQRELIAKGYELGEVDCQQGPAMRRAVRQFQRDSGIHVDGSIGEDTWCKLTGQCPTERVEEDDFKAPPVADEQIPDDQPEVAAACKPAAISASNKAQVLESWARKAARDNWAREAQHFHGEVYANPDNARVVVDNCEPLPVGMIKKYRCDFKAFPCRRADR